MSNEVFVSTTASDDKDNDLVVPLVVQDPSAVRIVPVKSSRNRLEVTQETECGIGYIRGKVLQRFANKNVYVFFYGLAGCLLIASYAYQTGTITTIEKRFKIRSKTIGMISVGYDLTQVSVGLALSYYAGKGHRPRWTAIGVYTAVAYCFLNSLPHILHGPGEDALSLTREYSHRYLNASSTSEAVDRDALKKLCVPNSEGIHCDESESPLTTSIILFVSHLIAGIGGTLFFNIGLSYMDDNVQKKKAPALISYNLFLRMVGPALGFALASFCLKLYIAPTLTPTIDNKDPRWLGAWWIGWIILGCLLVSSGSILGLFPRKLLKVAARKAAASERAKALNDANNKQLDAEPEMPASLSDMLATFKRLMKNRTLLCNNAAAVFYSFGYEPYWTFMAKYIETQYRQSASLSNLTTGSVGLVFSAAGVILAGLVITRYKPTARQMAMWNVFVGLISALGIASYALLGCPANSSFGGITPDGELQTDFECNARCDCEYVTYSPVCASDGKTAFISACHAGCSNFSMQDGETKTFTNCSCIPPANADPVELVNWTLSSPGWVSGGWAEPGSCPVDCSGSFFVFLAAVCLLKFSGASGRATNLLVSFRCVEERDKPVAMGIEGTILSLFAFIPAIIFYGYLIDTTCLVWGKTCTGTGNCWLYNVESMRYMLNLIAAALILIGTMFDTAVWYHVKDLKIFDEEDPLPLKNASNENHEEVRERDARNHVRIHESDEL